MHDWTLQTLSLAWREGITTLTLKGPEGPAKLIARGVQKMSAPRLFGGGPSVFVSKTEGPTRLESGALMFLLEMQSGDTIEIVAASFDVPQPQSWNKTDADD